MPIFSHNFDYIALAFLIASMLGAAAIAISRRSTGGQMSRERAATYRLHAAHCSELAQRFSDPQASVGLLEMAAAWLRLAELADAQQSAAAIAETDRAETAR